MQVTTFQGVVENGQIHFDTDVEIPENTRVYVVVPGLEDQKNGTLSLSEIISKMPDDYQPIEHDFGKPVGREEW